MHITTEEAAWAYTQDVAARLTAAELNITDAWADTTEDGFVGLIEIDHAHEAYCWTTDHGWMHLTGSGTKGAYNNSKDLLWGEDCPPDEIAEKITTERFIELPF